MLLSLRGNRAGERRPLGREHPRRHPVDRRAEADRPRRDLEGLRRRRNVPGHRFRPTSSASRSTRQDPDCRSKQATVAIEDENFYDHSGVDWGRWSAPRSRTPRPGSRPARAVRRSPSSWSRTSTSRIRDGHARAQDPRGEAGDGARGRALEALDPQPVPQHRVLRHQRRPHRGRRQGRGRGLLQQGRLRPRPEGVGAARRAAAGAVRVQPVPQPACRRSCAATRCSTRWPSRATSAGAKAQKAEAEGLGLDAGHRYETIHEPYFFDYVEQELIERYGVQQVREGGLKVYTTINPQLQAYAEQAVADCAACAAGPSTALASIDVDQPGTSSRWPPRAATRESQNNLAANAHRQPGSSFKPFVLTTALKQGIDPEHHLLQRHQRRRPSIPMATYGEPWTVNNAEPGGGVDEPRRRDDPLGQRRLRPARTSTSAPRTSRRRRTRSGSPARSTVSPPRRSAGFGSASRRSRWPTPTRASPTAAFTTT